MFKPGGRKSDSVAGKKQEEEKKNKKIFGCWKKET